jgi:hypothetical protein
MEKGILIEVFGRIPKAIAHITKQRAQVLPEEERFIYTPVIRLLVKNNIRMKKSLDGFPWKHPMIRVSMFVQILLYMMDFIFVFNGGNDQ